MIILSENNKYYNKETNDRDDWRFQGQDEYLLNVILTHCIYDGDFLDHEHCDFCSEKFSIREEDLHKGYCTQDKRHWICQKCFHDFKEMFGWEVIS